MITDFARSDARNFDNVTLFKHVLVRVSEIVQEMTWQMRGLLLLHCVIYSHFCVRNKLLSGTAKLPSWVYRGDCWFYYYFTTPFQVQKADKVRIWPQVGHKYFAVMGFDCMTEGETAENREVVNLWNFGSETAHFPRISVEVFLCFSRVCISSSSRPDFFNLLKLRVRIYCCNWSHWVTPHSVGLLWTRDRPVQETSTWQHTILTTDTHRTTLDEGSARPRDLYLTTHNTHKRQTSMLLEGFEPATLASDLPQVHALDLTATGIGNLCVRIKSVFEEGLTDKWTGRRFETSRTIQSNAFKVCLPIMQRDLLRFGQCENWHINLLMPNDD